MAGKVKFAGWPGGEIHVKNLRSLDPQPLFSIAPY